jgi:hypothetical protein
MGLLIGGRLPQDGHAVTLPRNTCPDARGVSLCGALDQEINVIGAPAADP